MLLLATPAVPQMRAYRRQWVRYRATYLRRGLDACAAGAQLRLTI